MTEPRFDIEEAIERSSLGTPAAKAARASVSDEEVTKVMQRSRDLENGCTCAPSAWWRGTRDCAYHRGLRTAD